MNQEKLEQMRTGKAKCPFFGRCGGCATQYLPYEIQLENKKKRLVSEIGYADVRVFYGAEWDYRNRMDMTFTPDGLGFREKGKWWKPLAIDYCYISTPRLNELKKEVEEFFGPDLPTGRQAYDAFHLKSHDGTYKYTVIRTPQNDSSVSIVLNNNSLRYDQAVKKVNEYAKVSTANNVLITNIKAKSSQSIGEDYEVVKGTDTLEEKIKGKTFRYSAQGFFQNNSVMAEKMHEYVHDLLKKYDTSGAHLLDLYGGVGAFGIVNADLFKGVTSVESFEGCTLAAKENIKLNGLKNVDAICMDAKRLKQVKLPSGDLYVITDPPRSGMDEETVIQLKKLRPAVMIYISCNVEQLGRDLPKFKDYKIKSVALFDLFPQTNHMESVVELVR
ncbi:RsmD family RNA methyltransferase [Patescibacteria group bacterium]|nr:RsmD family RNA methyltransferase [Patescibacteria group bacterium]MBU1685563.1 RsmD family RNA methyltransferase [Patescibacteria group bacterium]MBU1938488.1 RsmD family RNA methyltransferase [Patescibacteria group bacterium]